MFINVFISAYYIHFKGFFGRQNGRFYGRFDSRIAAAIADGVGSCESAHPVGGAYRRHPRGRAPAHAALAAAHPGHDPESLYILLTSAGGRAMLETAHTVIVDEVHAVAASKRGAHLALSLARLDALAGQGLRRIGLSATQRPVDEVSAARARATLWTWATGVPGTWAWCCRQARSRP